MVTSRHWTSPRKYSTVNEEEIVLSSSRGCSLGHRRGAQLDDDDDDDQVGIYFTAIGPCPKRIFWVGLGEAGRWNELGWWQELKLRRQHHEGDLLVRTGSFAGTFFRSVDKITKRRITKVKVCSSNVLKSSTKEKSFIPTWTLDFATLKGKIIHFVRPQFEGFCVTQLVVEESETCELWAASGAPTAGAWHGGSCQCDLIAKFALRRCKDNVDFLIETTWRDWKIALFKYMKEIFFEKNQTVCSRLLMRLCNNDFLMRQFYLSS